MAHPADIVSLFPFLKNDLMGHGPVHRLLEEIGVRIILVASTNSEIHTNNWIDRTLMMMMMMMMKIKKGG